MISDKAAVSRATLVKRMSAILGLVFLLGLVYLGQSDNHYTNAQYLVWKAGLMPSQYHACLRYINVDGSFRDSLKGKTVPELHKWFPVLVAPSLITDSYRKGYSTSMTDATWRWVGDTNTAIQFENGRVVGVNTFKG